MNMGACSDTLYAVTETKFAPNLLEQAKAVHRENTGDSSQNEEFDVLVQLFPSDDPQNPTVLEASPTTNDSPGAIGSSSATARPSPFSVSSSIILMPSAGMDAIPPPGTRFSSRGIFGLTSGSRSTSPTMTEHSWI